MIYVLRDLLQHGGNTTSGGNKGGNLVKCIIDRKRCPYHTGHAIARHQRLSAVMTRTNGDAQLVKQQTHVIAADISYQE